MSVLNVHHDTKGKRNQKRRQNVTNFSDSNCRDNQQQTQPTLGRAWLASSHVFVGSSENRAKLSLHG